ncbi:unnamed protein product [Adineta steineri]|uniref:Coiled-coil domain-containing protein 6 n=1 Tax=Adineta steineri TaxID=433720 RepID=A0A814XU54_9BILA|nr:unnamed protein product [Adineta steineri]CAF1472442.1 unnamed protein product [Adineta steineri]CAF1513130.1 unnamed protein product [Adineta steineri]CAF1636251.1 unnamed protein product [Adineta steineri]
MSNENIIQSMINDSEYESDVSSVADSSTRNTNESKLSCEHLMKRIDSLTQENRVLNIEVQTFKLRLKSSQQEIKQLKHASVNMQVKTEQEEEFISNTLFKKIQELKKEKETLANNYEREEEFLTNDLSKKLQQIREEKQSLEQSLEREQASQISQLMKRINRLEAETTNKQNTLEQLKREKIELENTLEKEQESLVNRLWKRMEKLETDKKLLHLQIQQSHPYNTSSNPTSSTNLTTNERLNIRSNSLFETNSSNRHFASNNDYAQRLKREVEELRQQLSVQQENYQKKMQEILLEEQNAKDENLRLQRKLQLEVDRREQLYRQLSESESSLEMDEERALNQKMKSNSKYKQTRTSSSSSSSLHNLARSRTASSPAFTINQNNEYAQRTRLPSNNFEDDNNNME